MTPDPEYWDVGYHVGAIDVQWRDLVSDLATTRGGPWRKDEEEYMAR